MVTLDRVCENALHLLVYRPRVVAKLHAWQTVDFDHNRA
jgi:hypothetical protein